MYANAAQGAAVSSFFGGGESATHNVRPGSLTLMAQSSERRVTEAGYRGRPSLMSQPLLRPLGSKRQKELRAAEIEGVGVRRRSYPEPPRPGLIPDTRNLLETWPREHRLLHCALLRCPLPGGCPGATSQEKPRYPRMPGLLLFGNLGRWPLSRNPEAASEFLVQVQRGIGAWAFAEALFLNLGSSGPELLCRSGVAPDGDF
jgi:hypothetical protein